MNAFKKIAVVGGAGYVGSALVPALLAHGHEVKVLDLFMFGQNVFGTDQNNKNLTLVKVDIRDSAALDAALRDQDAIIHLACISNDPSFELDPAVGKTINYDSMPGFLKAVKSSGAKRVVYASSSSVYGVKSEPNVREDSLCEPLTDYSKFKLLCEGLLAKADLGGADYVILRPATVCGYAPRMRLDLTVNILTIHALVKKKMTVFGGGQLRPNIFIDDMVAAYLAVLDAPAEKIRKQVFNAGYSNMSVGGIAELIRRQLGDPSIAIEVQPTSDNRSYHVNSDRIKEVLGFAAKHTLEDAVESVARAYRAGKIPEPLTTASYYNIKVVQALDLKAK